MSLERENTDRASSPEEIEEALQEAVRAEGDNTTTSNEKFSLDAAEKEGRGIQASAVAAARDSGAEHPTSEHYEKASRAIDEWRALNPEWADKFIEEAVMAKQWTEVIGVDMYKKLTDLFEESWWESLYAQKGKFSREQNLKDTRRRIEAHVGKLFKGKEHLLPIVQEIIDYYIESNTDKK